MINYVQIENYLVYENGTVFSIKRNKFLAPRIDTKGYNRLMIYDGNGNGKTIKAHRLVAECFIPNPENKPQVNHKNGIKDDNRVENLEWVTAKENVLYSYATGERTKQSHINSYLNRITTITALKIKWHLKYTNLNHREISKLFNISKDVVQTINSGARHKYLYVL